MLQLPSFRNFACYFPVRSFDMPRALTLLALVVAQVATSAGPVFLCVDREGAVCVDGGPQACHCREDGAAEAHQPCEAATSACHDHEPQIRAAAIAIEPADCDCTHRLVSRDHVATASRATAWTVDLHATPSDWAIVPSQPTLAALGISRLSVAAPLGDSLPLNFLSAVALRC
jgi:hypothetical protein